MSFLYPGFLFALFATAIPVIIHLFNFRRFKKVYFSNVKFLKEVDEQHSSKEKLKNLLILIARIFTIVFLVLAFAQPFVPSAKNNSASVTSAVSIYIDNSYSMQATNKDGSLLDEAKRKAALIVKGFGVNDRFQLLTNDFNGKDQRLLNREEFLKALDEVQISSISRTLQPIINLQKRILKGNANKFINLLSDFQKNIAGNKPLDISADISYNAIKLEPNSLPNVAADSVYFLSPNHQPGGSEKLVVVLKNYSSEAAKNIPIKLSINGSQKGAASLNLEAGATARDTLNFSGLTSGWQQAILNIKDYPINFDDSLFFSFNVNRNLPILTINGVGRGKYLSALYAADKYFTLSQMSEGNIDYDSFSSYKLIVLNGIQKPSTGLAQQLKNYVHSGGTLIILPYVSPNFSAYDSFLSNLSLPKIEKLDTIKTKVDKIDFDNPIFNSVFESIPKNIDYPTISRYFSFVENSKIDNTPIMQLPNGRILFGSSRFGGGNIYFSATSFDRDDSNLAISPLFVPLMYRAALMGNFERPLFYTLGQDQVILDAKVQLDNKQTLKLYANKFEAIPEIRNVDGRTTVYLADQIKDAGFYNLKLGDSLLSVFGFNNARSESDMSYLTKPQIEALASAGTLHVYDADKDVTKFSSGGSKITNTLWKLCIILSLIFIAVEIMLVKFFNKTTNQTI